MSAADVTPLVIDFLRIRICRVFPEQIRASLEQLNEEQIWWRPNEESNSVGNLVIHLTGSINHYLNRGIGGFEYDRDRDAEFAERKHIPKDELRRMFDEMVAKADQTLAALTPERAAAPSPEPKMYTIVLEDVLGVATHIANHAGQIVWIAKSFTGGMNDLWMKTHRSEGGWKKSRSDAGQP